MRRFVLVCLLMLLPLQWSVAATDRYGSHQEIMVPDSSWQLGETLLAAVDTGADARAPGEAAEEHACSSDCHVDDPLGLGVPPSGIPPQYAAARRFEYIAPISSHIPAGPERPDRLPAA